MNFPVKRDPVPTAAAGIKSFKCKCGWEAVFICPEEDEKQLVSILTHLVNQHGLDVPEFYVTNF